MTRGQLEARRRRLAELTARDRANRCPVCLRSLQETGVYQVWGERHAYCSPDCADEAREQRERSA